MKTKLTFFLLMMSFVLCAQITVNKRYTVSSKDGKVHYPVFNAAGDQLLLTTENFEGLALYDFTTQKTTEISKDAGSGYEPVFDEDVVIYKKKTAKNKEQFNALKRYDLKTQKTTVLSEPMRERKDLNKKTRTCLKKNRQSDISVVTEDLKLLLYRNGRATELDPANVGADYIWVSLSPDKSKILFTSLRKGTFVSDLSGTIIESLGKLNAPVWYGNDYIVGMNDIDDGHHLISSEIIIMSLDGKIKEVLTPKEEQAIYPAASAAGKRIAYSTVKGELHIMEISINR